MSIDPIFWLLAAVGFLALEGMTFSINGRNIADKRYVATCSAVSACYYGQGRSLTARLQFNW